MQLGWIDFSRNERNKILQTLKQLEEPSALDELGIGTIRDGYADILFPGISTLQTRAKYFVLLPYIFARVEQETFKRGGDILPWIHKQEDLLVPILINNSNDTNGIIGLRAHRQGKSVKVKPSSIYWNGMKTYEILRDEHLSISNVCSIIYGKSTRKRALTIKTEGKNEGDEGFDDETAGNENLPLFSPITPDYSVMTDSTMELAYEEAVYLFRKMTQAKATRNSLLAFMLKENALFPSFFEIDETALPIGLKEIVLLAKGFANFIYGAHLRYNVIFSNGEDTEQADKYLEWVETFDFSNFSLPDVLSKVNSNPHTTAFLKDFFYATKSRDIPALDRLIVNRERAIKQDRAKLHKPQEYRYDMNKPVHDYKLNYRYNTAFRIISDIITGMEG